MSNSVPQPIPYFLMEKIRQGIITGRYPPGSALREQTLETEYGTSRGPLREAMRLLQLRGLVLHEPRRGFRVREYSVELTQQIYRLRGLLERHAIEALAGKPLEPLLAELEQANAAMATHFAARQIEGYLEANIAFHDAIMRTADNEPLRKSIEPLNEMAQPIRFALLANRWGKSTAMDEHAQIIALLSQGKIQDAARSIEEHVVRNIGAASSLFTAQPAAAPALAVESRPRRTPKR